MRIATRLERHGEIERLHVARIGFTGSPIYWTSCYRVGGVLVDSGHVHARREVAAFVNEKPLEAALATHEHEDHVGNHRVLADRGIPSYAPQAAVDRLERVARSGARRLPLYRALAWGNHDGASGVRVANGVVKAGGRSVRLVPTPGHSEDHVALLDEESGALFTGDAVLGRLKFCRRQEDVPREVDSLRALRDAGARAIYPAHGRVFENPVADLDDMIAYFELLARRAHALAAKGRSLRAITRELLGPEPPLAYLSRGELAKRNVVASLLRRPS